MIQHNLQWTRLVVSASFILLMTNVSLEDMWLGATSIEPYTEKRVHPQRGYGRPGWLRIEAYGTGMITGWGTHHVDIAHWGMGTEYTGPIELEGMVKFPESGIWDVHGDYDVTSKYANGVTMHISHKNPNDVRFEGEDGWVFVARGQVRVTDSDPVSGGSGNEALRVSDPKLLDIEIGPNDIHLYESPDIRLDWLESIRSRRPAATNAEQSHRSCTTCLLNHIAMKLPRKLYWDPICERFKNDDEANTMLLRVERPP